MRLWCSWFRMFLLDCLLFLIVFWVKGICLDCFLLWLILMWFLCFFGFVLFVLIFCFMSMW